MSANDEQVGGRHYKTGGREHWDIVSEFGLDYFQGQITKYVMRWKHKHKEPEKRLEDLKKAEHFLQKYLEINAIKSPPEPISIFTPTGIAEILKLGNGTLPSPPKYDSISSDDNFKCEGWWGDLTQLYKCRHCGTYLRAVDLSNALLEHGNCAGAAYVGQGQATAP